MSYRSPSTAATDPSHVWDHDARVLAGVLRSSPLTILLSPAGVDTTPMLLHGVMPKLRRRASDRAPREPGTTGTVIPFADRRDSRAGLLARRDREIAVFFDVWTADPVAALLRQVQQAVDAPWMAPLDKNATLVETLADLQARHNLRFLLLLDRFEDALAQRVDSPGVGAFIEQWLAAIARPDLAAHFLVALPEAESFRFDGMRERIAHFDDRVLRANGSGRLFGLSSVSLAVPADVLAAVSASASAQVAASPPQAPVTPEPASAASPAPSPTSARTEAPPLPPTPARAPAVESDDDFMASLSDLGQRVAASVNESTRRPSPSTPDAPPEMPVMPTMPVMRDAGPPTMAPVAPAAPEAPRGVVADTMPVLNPEATAAGPREEPPGSASEPVPAVDLRPSPMVAAFLAEPAPAPPVDDPFGPLAGAPAVSARAWSPTAPVDAPPQPRARADRPSADPIAAASAGGTALPPSARAPSPYWLALPLVAAALWWWFDRDAPTERPPAPTRPDAVAVAPPRAAARQPVDAAPVAPSVPAPDTQPRDSLIGPAALDIAVEPANGTDTRVARELTRALSPPGGIELPALPARGGLASLVDLDAASTAPRLAIANYDALQAARTLPVRPQLQVVTPLYMQEIYFIVRADSPLRFLHDLRNARIDAGPADGSRSLTASAVYRRLFGVALPGAASGSRNEDDALAELLAFRTIDVVATVGGQPLPWLANLPKATRDRIRLLRLDGRDPVDRLALQTFLPSTVHGLELGGEALPNIPTLAVMSFLVTNAKPDDVQASAKLTDFARGLCHALPALQLGGHPKWSEVSLGLALPTGFTESTAALEGFRDCRGPATPAAGPVPHQQHHTRRPT